MTRHSAGTQGRTGKSHYGQYSAALPFMNYEGLQAEVYEFRRNLRNQTATSKGAKR